MNILPNPTNEILSFKPISEVDAEQLFPLAVDPEVTQYLLWDATTKEDMVKFYSFERESFENGKNYSFVVSTISPKCPIGSGGLIGVNKINRSSAIAYWLGKQFWNSGYGTEIVKSLLRFGFDILDLHRIYCAVRTENIASIRVLEKNRFRKEGHAVKALWRHGQFRDLYQYAILEEEFRNEIK